MRIKTLAMIFIATGIIALVAAILFAFAVGGLAVTVLMILSVTLNSLGITILRNKQAWKGEQYVRLFKKKLGGRKP